MLWRKGSKPLVLHLRYWVWRSKVQSLPLIWILCLFLCISPWRGILPLMISCWIASFIHVFLCIGIFGYTHYQDQCFSLISCLEVKFASEFLAKYRTKNLICMLIISIWWPSQELGIGVAHTLQLINASSSLVKHCLCDPSPCKSQFWVGMSLF